MDKLPLIIDQRDFRTSVDALMSLERAQKIEAVAARVGGYSVGIVAASGDPYRVVYDDEAGAERTTAAMIVPDGKVIMSMRNITNPNAPTDISGLNRAADEQT
jgi:hypothetical protein